MDPSGMDLLRKSIEPLRPSAGLRFAPARNDQDIVKSNILRSTGVSRAYQQYGVMRAGFCCASPASSASQNSILLRHLRQNKESKFFEAPASAGRRRMDPSGMDLLRKSTEHLLPS
ncbi:MAG: hypothetical protein KDD53_08200, partial [Bdellovibrionales bacterium]|nr:hypothetical protein [Bdellovibrionales bacterium]